MTGHSARLVALLALPLLFESAVPAPAVAQTVSFIARRDFPAGGAPFSLVVGDFNGDRVPDVAVANYGSHDISMLRGHGDGTFQAPLTFATGGRWPVSVAVGDFNGDGRPDLAVANSGTDARPCCHYDPGDVSVLVGNGDGTFQAPLTFGGGEHPSAVAVGDFNGDGKLDLAVTSYESCLGCTFHGPGRVSVFPGNGDGTFQPPRSFDTGSLPIIVAVGDFNGDGVPDLAVANSFPYPANRRVSVFFGNGDGTFQAAVNSSVAEYQVAVGDFNGDGKLDLAAASPESNTVSVLLGNGDGTFQPAVDSPGRGTPIAVGDFNGDGALDLALATNSQSNTVSVLLGKGDGTFQSPLTFGVGSGPYSAAVGDFNGDGKLDLAVSNSYTATVSILLGNGDGTFLDTPNFPAGNTMPTSVAVGDFNGDGKQDVAVANTSSWVCDPRCHWGSGAVSVLLGNGDGTFRAPLTYAAGSYPSAVVVGDLNGDGVPDVAVANYGSHDISVLLGHGDGTFQAAVNLPAGDFPASVAVGDFNRDGKLDLAVGHYSSSDVSVLLGNGDGTFQPALTFASAATGAVAVGDFNNDGSPDLAVRDRASNAVSVLLGNGDGTFRAPLMFAAAGYGDDTPAAADFDGDGNLDLAVADGYSDTVSVLLGNGDGTFRAPRAFAVGRRPISVAVGDFNRDGILDLAVADAYSDTVSVLLGNGDGSFAAALAFGVGSGPTSIAVGNFDELAHGSAHRPKRHTEGAGDLVTANSLNGDISVLINNTPKHQPGAGSRRTGCQGRLCRRASGRACCEAD